MRTILQPGQRGMNFVESPSAIRIAFFVLVMAGGGTRGAHTTMSGPSGINTAHPKHRILQSLPPLERARVSCAPRQLRLYGGQSAASVVQHGSDDSVGGAGPRGDCDSSVEVISISEEDMPFEQCEPGRRSAGKRLCGGAPKRTEREMPNADSKKPGFASAEQCRSALREILDRPG